MNLLSRRPIVIVVSVAVLALLVVARPSLYPTATPASPASNPSGSATGTSPVVPVVDLELQRLQSAAATLPESERDPFRFRPKPPPPAPRVQTQPPPSAFVPAVAADPSASQSIALKYFGVMTIQGELVAAFIDGRGNTFRGKEGDILEGRYRLLRVGRDSADLAYLDGRGRQTIRLTGQ